MSGAAAVSAAIVAPLAVGDPERYAGLSALLAIEAGVVFILFGWLKAGFVSQFVAPSVQVGFMFGLGLTIIVGQAAKVLGVSSGEGTFFQQVRHLLSHLDEVNGWTVVVGLSGLAAMLAFMRLMPAAPAALIVVGVAILLVTLFGLADRGVSVVGEISRQVPLPAVPKGVDLGDLITLFPAALAIALIGYTETNSVSEQFAEEHKYDIRPNQELVALGAANILSGLFKGFVTGGGASQSAANDKAGAKTQVAILVMAALIFLTAALLLPIFENLPQAVLGAIVISAVVGFVNVPALQRVRRLRGDSFVFAIVALVGVLVLGVVPGLLLTVVLTVLLLMGHLSRPPSSLLGGLPGTRVFVSTDRHPEAIVDPEVLIFRPDVPLIFINAGWLRDSFRERLRQADPPPRVVVIDLQMSADLDIKGLDALTQIADELSERGVELRLANVHAPVQDMLRRGGLATKIGESRIFWTIGEAVRDGDVEATSNGRGLPGVDEVRTGRRAAGDSRAV
jgi:high affinity sulfate transporter 1